MRNWEKRYGVTVLSQMALLSTSDGCHWESNCVNCFNVNEREESRRRMAIGLTNKMNGKGICRNVWETIKGKEERFKHYSQANIAVHISEKRPWMTQKKMERPNLRSRNRNWGLMPQEDFLWENESAWGVTKQYIPAGYICIHRPDFLQLGSCITHSLIQLRPSREAANCASTQELPSILAS
jgi:hypothetical protein